MLLTVLSAHCVRTRVFGASLWMAATDTVPAPAETHPPLSLLRNPHTADIQEVPPVHPTRHKTILKDVRTLEAADVDNKPVDLIFFDVG